MLHAIRPRAHRRLDSDRGVDHEALVPEAVHDDGSPKHQPLGVPTGDVHVEAVGTAYRVEHLRLEQEVDRGVLEHRTADHVGKPIGIDCPLVGAK